MASFGVFQGKLHASVTRNNSLCSQYRAAGIATRPQAWAPLHLEHAATQQRHLRRERSHNPGCQGQSIVVSASARAGASAVASTGQPDLSTVLKYMRASMGIRSEPPDISMDNAPMEVCKVSIINTLCSWGHDASTTYISRTYASTSVFTRTSNSDHPAFYPPCKTQQHTLFSDHCLPGVWQSLQLPSPVPFPQLSACAAHDGWRSGSDRYHLKHTHPMRTKKTKLCKPKQAIPMDTGMPELTRPVYAPHIRTPAECANA